MLDDLVVGLVAAHGGDKQGAHKSLKPKTISNSCYPPVFGANNIVYGSNHNGIKRNYYFFDWGGGWGDNCEWCAEATT